MIIHDVEQGSPSWFQARLGIPTASKFSRLVTGTGLPSSSLPKYARELAAEVFAGKTLDAFDGNSWMDRGKEMEEEALNAYSFIHDAELQRVGLITNDAGTAGCSPDALIGDDGGLEIKCLKAESHLEIVTYHKKNDRAPPKYTPQVQGCLLITGRKSWTQLFYHPDLPPLVIKNVPDLVFHAALDKAITALIAERDDVLKTMKHEQTHIPESKTA